ncbi:MAG: sugar ABC transporter ATP-binding protein [Planctomycetes bacterium]|nr:sugar ABC transporter ATP-binding protein [Planctomycetota bacterium]
MTPLSTDAAALRLAMVGVGKRFGATAALDGVDFALRVGEVHALVGENGAGKSTLMKVLSGALALDAGSIQLDGEPYAPRSPAEARAAGVAMIYQELSLAPHLSVAENVLLGAQPTRRGIVSWAALRARARALLNVVGRPSLDLDAPVATLAAADRQLVEIARALARDARVIVFDEPTSSLGNEDVARLFALIRDLARRGVSIVYISHALEEVFAIAERFTVLRDGSSVASGRTSETDASRLVAAMVGRSVGELYPRSPARPGEVVATVRALAGERLPREATLEIRRGEVLGLAGLVGAGRSEFLRALFGLERVRSGELRILALDGPRTPTERWAQGVGFVSEDRKSEGLALGLSVADNLVLAGLDRCSSHGVIAPARVERDARAWIERLGIRCLSPRQPVGRLSGGNQQKVALARLLHADADVLLLDEPTRGVDVGSKAEIYRLIDELARSGERPRAVVVVSSYLPELFGTCDRIAVMTRGRLGPARDVGELDEHAVMLEATGAGR